MLINLACFHSTCISRYLVAAGAVFISRVDFSSATLKLFEEVVHTFSTLSSSVALTSSAVRSSSRWTNWKRRWHLPTIVTLETSIPTPCKLYYLTFSSGCHQWTFHVYVAEKPNLVQRFELWRAIKYVWHLVNASIIMEKYFRNVWHSKATYSRHVEARR